MTDEKGYIQYECDWQPAPSPAGPLVAELIAWRDRLFARGLIGVYPDGIGFGNVSARDGEDFIITGTATGSIPFLEPAHVTRVVDYDIEANRVSCRGPLQASSEALSHAAVYEAAPAANVVIHVHHLRLWQHLCGRIGTTDASAEAGTPAMARAIAALFRAANPPRGIFAMGGHREGIMAYGARFADAAQALLRALDEFEKLPQLGC